MAPSPDRVKRRHAVAVTGLLARPTAVGYAAPPGAMGLRTRRTEHCCPTPLRHSIKRTTFSDGTAAPNATDTKHKTYTDYSNYDAVRTQQARGAEDISAPERHLISEMTLPEASALAEWKGPPETVRKVQIRNTLTLEFCERNLTTNPSRGDAVRLITFNVYAFSGTRIAQIYVAL